LLYRFFPNQSIAATGVLANFKVNATGAFAGYLVLFAAMIPFVFKTYDIVGDFLHPYWTIRRRCRAFFDAVADATASGSLVPRDEVVRYATPFVRADSGDCAWLVVPGAIKGAISGTEGSSLYLFKNRLPHLVEGEEAAQRLKALSPQPR
jgi:hypothetical protein